MGLRRCFVAEETIWHTRWVGADHQAYVDAGKPDRQLGPPGSADDYGDPNATADNLVDPPPGLIHRYPFGVPCFAGWNDALIKTPRLYRDEFVQGSAGNNTPGLIYAEEGINAWGRTALTYYGFVNEIGNLTGGSAMCKLDGQYGRRLYRQAWPYLLSHFIVGGFAYEPNMDLPWEFSGSVLLDDYNAVAIDKSTMDLNAGLGAVAPGVWGISAGIHDFAIDRPSDRVFWRTGTDSNRVQMFRYGGTREKIADLYGVGTTSGIVLTHDGYAYIHDANGWICCYDFDGRFHNAFRNTDQAAYAKVSTYGWDKFYKRLLFVGGTPHATDGSCRLRFEAFWPEPLSQGLTPPLPRSVPRATRRTYFTSRLYGEGGEPLGSRYATLSGAATGTVLGDNDGDISAVVTPVAAGGGQALTVSVEAAPSVPRAAEPDHVETGRTLVVDLANTGQATATGCTPGGSVAFWFFTYRLGGHLRRTAYGTANEAGVAVATAGSFPSDPPYGTFSVAGAVDMDSGNVGHSNTVSNT